MRGTASLAVTGLMVLVIWQAVIWIWEPFPFILPPPVNVVEALWRFRGMLADDALVTAQEVFLGLGLGVALGVATALQLAGSPFARTHVRPVLVFMQAVPIFALAPILVIWFGFGLGPKIAVVVMVTYFPVASALADGLMNVPDGYRDLARSMGARPGRELLLVRLPHAVPAFCSGLRLAAVYAPVAAFIGEWVGASEGLGARMVHANGRTQIDLMFAALLVFAGMTVLLHQLVDRSCDRLVARYG